MDKIEYFKRYLSNPNLYDESYDCSEIAEDFLNDLKEGYILRFSVKDMPYGLMKLKEFGEIVEYNYHEVYTDGEFPVRAEDYVEEIRKLNENEIEIVIRTEPLV